MKSHREFITVDMFRDVGLNLIRLVWAVKQETPWIETLGLAWGKKNNCSSLMEDITWKASFWACVFLED